MMKTVVAYVEWQWVCPSCGLEESKAIFSSYPFKHICDNCNAKYIVTD